MITATPDLMRAAKKSVAPIILLLLWLSPPAQARPCACCIVPGAWYERSETLDNYQLEIINGLKLYQAAKLSLPEGAGPRGISAGGNMLAEDFKASISRSGRRWTFTLKTKDGKTGSLALTLPMKATHFGVDLEADVRAERNAHGKLYKEIRFKGPVRGTGIFEKGNVAGTTFLLVLNGVGNNCMNVEDFKSWRLIVSGPRASYSFLGAFIAPAQQ